jgi:hypothetical protein
VRLVNPLEIAVVSADADFRRAAAAAFDSAPASWTVTIHDSQPDAADVLVLCPDAIADPGGLPSVRFRPAAASELVREVAAAASAPSAGLIPVVGAGRGVGVTSVALHLCKAIADASARDQDAPCFVDLDVEWGAATRLDLDASEVRTWAAMGDTAEELVLSALPVAGGFRALLAPRGGGPEIDPAEVLARAIRCWSRVVVDCPDGDAFALTAERCRGAVLVTPPTRPGAIRARALVRRWPDLRWAVITNKLGPGGETTRAEIQEVIGHKIALELPCAPSLRDAEDDGRLLRAPWSRWGRGIARLARTLQRL